MKKQLLTNLYNELEVLKNELIEHSCDNSNNQSIQNLKAYTYLRSKDITTLQEKLTSFGLSSLGRSQSCIISAINQDLIILSALLGTNTKQLEAENNFLNFNQSKELMDKNATVFGAADSELITKIMVTLPSFTKDSPILIKNLISIGTSVLRINTAHDNPSAWKEMAKTIQEENKLQNKDTKIYVDLAGPKNRTGSIVKVVQPFKIGSKEGKKVEIVPQILAHFHTKGEGEDERELATLVVDDNFYLKAYKAKHKVIILDFEKEKKHSFKVIVENERLFAIVDKKVFISPDTKIMLKLQEKTLKSKLHNFITQPEVIRLFRNDSIIITPNEIDGSSNYDYEGSLYFSIISCSNKEIFNYVQVGDNIFIDDGKIGCKVEKILPIGLECRVFLAKENGTVLKEEKGINFPDTDLVISAITPTDERNFNDIVEYADIIGISFAQSKEDIKKLQELLQGKNKTNIAIVPKIETKLALKNLPQILEQLLQSEKYAVMIARGDLAIEVGFDNLPYIQEEIFSICEAAHVPVIYATQILEGKMKNNLPSRAEVIDAANAQRADCVMLNKGPFVVDTVVSIKNILRSVHTLFHKNRQLLSVCELWRCDS
jgi:pyruvate kinase